MSGSTQPAERTVHTRWVWLGLVLSVLGVVVSGAGIMAGSWWLGVLGVAALAVGVLIGWRAGWMYDTHAARPASEETRQVVEGDVHQGWAPGQMVQDPEAKATAVEVDARRAALLQQSHRTPAPPWAAVGAATLLLTALLLLVAAMEFYPHNVTGHLNALRSLGFAIVAALVGVRVLGTRGRPHPVAAFVGFVSGALQVILAWTLAHTGTGLQVGETLAGAAVMLGALAVLDWRPRREGVN